MARRRKENICRLWTDAVSGHRRSRRQQGRRRTREARQRSGGVVPILIRDGVSSTKPVRSHVLAGFAASLRLEDCRELARCRAEAEGEHRPRVARTLSTILTQAVEDATSDSQSCVAAWHAK